MRYRNWLFVLLFALPGLPCLDGPPPTLLRMELELGDGEVLRYALAVPAEPADGGAVPLVLALHYGGQVTPYYGMGYLESLVLPGLELLGAVIVAPDCPGRGWTDPRSERAMLALLDHAYEAWPVDRQRVVVTGFSMGGIGTWFMAARHPERFSAAIPVAGVPVELPEGSLPIYAIHGAKDEIIELEPSRAAIGALERKGASAKLVVVAGLSHYETASYTAALTEAADWVKALWQAGEESPRGQE